MNQVPSKTRRGKNKVVIVKDEEHKELLAEFKEICRKTKDKK
jgi:hypothetical protein